MPTTFKAISRMLFASCILFYSCTNTTNNDTLIKALDEGISKSNKIILRESETIIKELEDKLSDPRTVEKARYWYARAQQISYLADTLFAYIDEIKRQEGKQPGFLLKNNKGLYQKLKQYKKEVLETDREFAEAFTNTVVITTEAFDSLNHTEKDFSQTFFENTSSTGIIAILNKFQNNIRCIENSMIAFCNNKVGMIWDGYYQTFSAIAASSSTYVQPGEKIEITAGVGSFSRAALPEITINNKIIPLNAEGCAIHKIKAPEKPGRYYTPVKIIFTDELGNLQTIQKNIEYTVAGKQENDQ